MLRGGRVRPLKQAHHAELKVPADDTKKALELALVEPQLLMKNATRRGEDGASRVRQPSRDGCAMHPMEPCELIEREPIFDLIAKEVALFGRQLGEGANEGIAEGLAVLRPNEVELHVLAGEKVEILEPALALATFITVLRERCAGCRDLHERIEGTEACVAREKRGRAFFAGEQINDQAIEQTLRIVQTTHTCDGTSQRAFHTAQERIDPHAAQRLMDDEQVFKVKLGQRFLGSALRRERSKVRCHLAL